MLLYTLPVLLLLEWWTHHFPHERLKFSSVLSQFIPVHISRKLLPFILGLILFIHLFPSSSCLVSRGYKRYFPNCRIAFQLSNLSAGKEMKWWNTPLYSFVDFALGYLPYILLIFLVSCSQTPLNYMAQGQFRTSEKWTEASGNYWNVRIWQLLYEVFL